MSLYLLYHRCKVRIPDSKTGKVTFTGEVENHKFYPDSVTRLKPKGIHPDLKIENQFLFFAQDVMEGHCPMCHEKVMAWVGLQEDVKHDQNGSYTIERAAYRASIALINQTKWEKRIKDERHMRRVKGESRVKGMIRDKLSGKSRLSWVAVR